METEEKHQRRTKRGRIEGGFLAGVWSVSLVD